MHVHRILQSLGGVKISGFDPEINYQFLGQPTGTSNDRSFE